MHLVVRRVTREGIGLIARSLGPGEISSTPYFHDGQGNLTRTQGEILVMFRPQGGFPTDPSSDHEMMLEHAGKFIDHPVQRKMTRSMVVREFPRTREVEFYFYQAQYAGEWNPWLRGKFAGYRE